MRVALAAAFEPARSASASAGHRDVGAERLDRRQHGKRVGHPMLAALRDGEGQLAFEQRRADQASAAFRADGMDRVDVGIAAAEGDDLVGMPPRGLDQPVAMRRVVGEDRDAVGLEPVENLRLGVGDRLFRAEILDMRGGDRGDQRDMRADLARSAPRSRRHCSCPFRAPRYSASRGIRARLSGTPVWLL